MSRRKQYDTDIPLEELIDAACERADTENICLAALQGLGVTRDVAKRRCADAFHRKAQQGWVSPVSPAKESRYERERLERSRKFIEDYHRSRGR